LKSLKFVTLSLIALLTVTGCTPQPPVAEKNSIVVYAGRDEELVQPLVEMFEQETGIEVEVRDRKSVV
jgi:iron(III) transport system substrate-binding protein